MNKFPDLEKNTDLYVLLEWEGNIKKYNYIPLIDELVELINE